MKKVFIFIVLSIGFISQCVQSKSLRACNEINKSFEESLSGSDNFENDSVNKLQALNKQNHNQTNKQIILDENDEAFKILFENFSKKFLNFKTTTMKEAIDICQIDRHADWNPICNKLKDSIDSIIENDFEDQDRYPLRGLFESSPLYVKASVLVQALTSTYNLIGLSALLYLGYAKKYISREAINKLINLRQNILNSSPKCIITVNANSIKKCLIGLYPSRQESRVNHRPAGGRGV